MYLHKILIFRYGCYVFININTRFLDQEDYKERTFNIDYDTRSFGLYEISLKIKSYQILAIQKCFFYNDKEIQQWKDMTVIT